ncbi:hypothetical protein SAICODRAFT_7182 [Saitoella complicata NRRL Y-17804]|nr:uncharacterized protein SAICODRAFT_7182 [Saitoella complicata NRRL Y-17804]ODQ53470.1 hypothetical protein SAICODRAFT_7182 [Saitoella complicata NRRL Y-17804]
MSAPIRDLFSHLTSPNTASAPKQTSTPLAPAPPPPQEPTVRFAFTTETVQAHPGYPWAVPPYAGKTPAGVNNMQAPSRNGGKTWDSDTESNANSGLQSGVAGQRGSTGGFGEQGKRIAIKGQKVAPKLEKRALSTWASEKFKIVA